MLLIRLRIVTAQLLPAAVVICALFRQPDVAHAGDEPNAENAKIDAQADQPKAVAWTQVASLEGHKDSVDAIAIGPDLVATGGPEGVVRIWDIPKQKVVRTYSSYPEERLPVHALYFSPDGRFVTSIPEGGAIAIFAVSPADTSDRCLGKGDCNFRAMGPDHRTWLRRFNNEIHLWEMDFLGKQFNPGPNEANSEIHR
jgi:WD40 repeat protein